MVGLDIGTSLLVSARSEEKDKITYREHRDAFYKISPTSPIAAKMIEKGLQGTTFFKEGNTFIVTGQDAINKAIERNDSALRPLKRGVLSPEQKDSLPILKFILKELLGEPKSTNEICVYSIPGQPIDVPDYSFDVGYHEGVIGNFIKELGYETKALNEAEAIGYSELLDNSLTGLAISFGAGMVNFCLLSSGEVIAKFSITKGGDWVDRLCAVATQLPDSVVQAEKEAGGYSVSPSYSPQTALHAAIKIYYERLMEYAITQMCSYLSSVVKIKFKESVPVRISGGTVKAEGSLELFNSILLKHDDKLPFLVASTGIVRDPLRVVARGCLIASEAL